MLLTRRGFLKTCLALGAAPVIVRAESLMKLWVPQQELIVPITDSTQFMCAQLEAAPGGRYVASVLVNTGAGWMRQGVSGLVDGAPTVSINAKGEIAIVGARDCVSASAPLGENFTPKNFGLSDGMILTGDATYEARDQDVYTGSRGVVGQHSNTPKPSRLVRNLLDKYQEEPASTNLLVNTSTFDTNWRKP